MDVKIEKGISIPPKKLTQRLTLLKEMDIGDSIVCNEKVSITLRAIAHRHGMDCTTRKIEDDFYRLWRTK